MRALRVRARRARALGGAAATKRAAERAGAQRYVAAPQRAARARQAGREDDAVAAAVRSLARARAPRLRRAQAALGRARALRLEQAPVDLELDARAAEELPTGAREQSAASAWRWREAAASAWRWQELEAPTTAVVAAKADPPRATLQARARLRSCDVARLAASRRASARRAVELEAAVSTSSNPPKTRGRSSDPGGRTSSPSLSPVTGRRERALP